MNKLNFLQNYGIKETIKQCYYMRSLNKTPTFYGKVIYNIFHLSLIFDKCMFCFFPFNDIFSVLKTKHSSHITTSTEPPLPVFSIVTLTYVYI